MIRKSVLLAFLVALTHALPSAAQTEPASQCLKDTFGNVICPPPGGWISKDSFGRYACSRGPCLRDALGNLVCSAQTNGFVMLDERAQIVCTGGCQPPRVELCQRPR